MLALRIYYGDQGRIWTCDVPDDCSWSAAPAYGLGGVVWAHPDVGRAITRRGKYYILAPWKDDQPHACDDGGIRDLFQYIDHPLAGTPPPLIPDKDLIEAGVKFAREFLNPTWGEMRRRMREDPGLPPRSASLPSERPPETDSGETI